MMRLIGMLGSPSVRGVAGDDGPALRVEHRLTPAAMNDYVTARRVIGLSLAAFEKTMQIAYERRLLPVERQHPPWLERIQAQS